MDTIELMNHIKDLTSDSMTVFISEPIALEKQIHYIPFTRNSKQSFIIEKDGEKRLSWTGSVYAKMALENMTKAARFYMTNKEQLRSFFKKYQDECERMSRAYNIVRERREQANGWHDHAVLIRQERDINSKRKELFSEMYRTHFGSDAPVIAPKIYWELRRQERDR